jgi:ribosomal protein S18 acetylase RimI-like enzyme
MSGSPVDSASLLVVRVRPDHTHARSVLAGLAIESSRRLGGTSCDWFSKLRDQAEEHSGHHDGGFLVLLSNGRAIAGGSYRREDPETAEVTRIWTDSAHRRRGVGRRLLAELEADIGEFGYRTVVVAAGPRQAEARGLYEGSGYRPVSGWQPGVDDLGEHRFEKHLESWARLATSA